MHITVACMYIFGVNVRIYIPYLYIIIPSKLFLRSPGQSYLGHRKLITMINMFCMLTL